MSNTQDDSMNTAVFWQTSRDFLYVHHEKIRKSSPNTVKSYKTGINQYISFLETEKEKKREDICFNDFKRDNLKLYTDWMLGKKLADKTCNLRLTALHSLLEYAAYEYADIMPVYINALTVKGVKLKDKPIEIYFLEVSRYIHLNPVKAQMVREPLDYKYSSYANFLSDDKDTLFSQVIDTSRVLSGFRNNPHEQYRMFVEGKISHAEQELLIQKDMKEDDMWLPW